MFSAHLLVILLAKLFAAMFQSIRQLSNHDPENPTSWNVERISLLSPYLMGRLTAGDLRSARMRQFPPPSFGMVVRVM